jgi:hypothetical protein
MNPRLSNDHALITLLPLDIFQWHHKIVGITVISFLFYHRKQGQGFCESETNGNYFTVRTPVSSLPK